MRYIHGRKQWKYILVGVCDGHSNIFGVGIRGATKKALIVIMEFAVGNGNGLATVCDIEESIIADQI